MPLLPSSDPQVTQSVPTLQECGVGATAVKMTLPAGVQGTGTHAKWCAAEPCTCDLQSPTHNAMHLPNQQLASLHAQPFQNSSGRQLCPGMATTADDEEQQIVLTSTATL